MYNCGTLYLVKDVLVVALENLQNDLHGLV
jgi:hypothetical protein